jgi:hypothetical protein
MRKRERGFATLFLITLLKSFNIVFKFTFSKISIGEVDYR